MFQRNEILQTIEMFDQQHLDIRTITMGVSLLDCADTDMDRSCTKIYDKICRLAGALVRTGEEIEAGWYTREEIRALHRTEPFGSWALAYSWMWANRPKNFTI